VTIIEKYSNIEIYKNPFSERWADSRAGEGGGTEKANSRFSQFCERV